MKLVVQRVKKAKVDISGQTRGEIGQGLLILVGVGQESEEKSIDFLANKVVNLRIFEDENGKMNRSLLDIDGELLVISQFTLYGDVQKGRRPSFSKAAPPEKGIDYYNKFLKELSNYNIKNIATGEFGANMQVDFINDGPVTIIIEDLRGKNA